MKKIKILNAAVLAAAALSLASCGGESDDIKDPTGGTTSDKLFDTSALVQDLEKDVDGTPLFDEEIRLDVWSVIGDPDQAVFRNIIQQFNDEYAGQIYLDVTYVGHFDYYNALDSTYKTDFDESFPDVCFMHNEKTIEYAYKNYFYPLDTLYEATGVNFDFTQVYDNIGRTTMYRDHRFGIPVDAHGFVTQFRQDIIKKNNLGFDGNTRFIPENRAEYQQLLEGLRTKADAGQLLIRNINKGADHSWHYADKNSFYPSYDQSTDPDGISALYANGGTLLDSTQTTVTFQNNKGFQTYLTDQVERFNNKLIGTSGSQTEMFGAGNVVMFSEGPWWVSQTYSLNWNNSDLLKEGNGVSKEDATDPVYNQPYVASRPTGWWTIDENSNSATANKWYGNGHVVTLTRHIKSMKKAAAALTFANWYTQSKNDKGEYNLVKWNATGHLPAWKNVYESQEYKKALKTNITLQALGNPEDIIALEGLEYASTLVSGIATSCSNVIAEYKKTGTICTKEQALAVLNRTATETQATLDLLKMGF